MSNQQGRARQLGASAFLSEGTMRLPIIVALLSVLMFSTGAAFLFVWLAWIFSDAGTSQSCAGDLGAGRAFEPLS